jgi:hypothetical protein
MDAHLPHEVWRCTDARTLDTLPRLQDEAAVMSKPRWNEDFKRYFEVTSQLRDEGWPVMGEAELVDPHLESGSFVLPVVRGRRGKYRDLIRVFAATHKPDPIRVSITSGLPDGRFTDDVFYVVTL